MRAAALLSFAIACSPGSATPRASVRETPYVLVLGTAQDAGLPQIGSDSPNSRRARRQPEFRRLVASLLIVDPASGKRWLIDATPDIREQVDAARGHPSTRKPAGPRPPLFDGIFLTHAHMGHYIGLAQLGREAYAEAAVPVLASKAMTGFLDNNGPWDLLVHLKHIELRTIAPDGTVKLTGDLSITPIEVPHRSEYTDTLGFLIEGPTRSLLYIPDIDKWKTWDERIEDVIARVDTALLDGTFYADGEIPGRSMKDIPHPFIVESIERFSAINATEREKIWFTHLNHSNPATDPASDAAKAISDAGMGVASDGQIFDL